MIMVTLLVLSLILVSLLIKEDFVVGRVEA